MKNGFDIATMGSIFYLIKKEKIEAKKKKKNKELEKLKQYYAKITNSVTKTRENSSTTFGKHFLPSGYDIYSLRPRFKE